MCICSNSAVAGVCAVAVSRRNSVVYEMTVKEISGNQDENIKTCSKISFC